MTRFEPDDLSNFIFNALQEATIERVEQHLDEHHSYLTAEDRQRAFARAQQRYSDVFGCEVD